MNPVVIRLSPRRIERLIFVILLLFFVFTTVYYSYVSDYKGYVIPTCELCSKEGDAQTKESNATNLIAKANMSSNSASNRSNTVQANTTAQTTKNASAAGKVDITIGPLNYEKKISGTYEKAVIEKVTFIIKNGMNENLNMKVNIYVWDSSTPEDSAARTTPKETITFPAIKAGSTLANTYTVKNLNLYNLDLTKVITFEFQKLDGTAVKTETKFLNIV